MHNKKEHRYNSTKLIFILVIFFASVGPISSDLYLPSLPIIAAKLHTSIFLTQMTVAIFVLGFGLARIFYGLISDAIGRRYPLMLALIFCVFGSLICWVAPDVYVLLMGRLIQGFGAGGSNILARIILRDRFEGVKLAQYSSYYSMAGITLMAGAPFLGGYLEYYFKWRVSFFLLTIYALLALVLAVFVYTETNMLRNKDSIKFPAIRTNLKTLFMHPVFLKSGILLAMAYGCMLAWLTAGPIVLEKTLGLTSIQFGWAAGIVGFCYFVGAYVNGTLVNRFRMRNMILAGAFCVAIASILLIIPALLHQLNVILYVLPVAIAIFGLSMFTPNAYAAALTPFPSMAGIAAATLGTIQIIGGFLASTMIATSPNINQFPTGIVFLVASVVSFILILAVKGKK